MIEAIGNPLRVGIIYYTYTADRNQDDPDTNPLQGGGMGLKPMKAERIYS